MSSKDCQHPLVQSVGEKVDQTCEAVSQSDGACVRLSPWQVDRFWAVRALQRKENRQQKKRDNKARKRETAGLCDEKNWGRVRVETISVRDALTRGGLDAA